MAPPTNHQPGTPALSVIIPMYREARRIEATLVDALPELADLDEPCEVLLIDDGSDDDTADAVKPFLREGPEGSLRRVRLISHRSNRGKGAAVRTGLTEAEGQWRLIMDADNAATIRELAVLRAAIGPGVGLIAGSRVVEGSRVDAVASRKLTGTVFKLALRAMGMDLLRDTQCGFKLYRQDVAEQVVTVGRDDGYAFDLEHLLIARATGLRTVEIGITWAHREGGQISPVLDGLRMLRCAATIRARKDEIVRDTRALPSSPTAEHDPPVVVTVPAGEARTLQRSR